MLGECVMVGIFKPDKSLKTISSVTRLRGSGGLVPSYDGDGVLGHLRGSFRDIVRAHALDWSLGT